MAPSPFCSSIWCGFSPDGLFFLFLFLLGCPLFLLLLGVGSYHPGVELPVAPPTAPRLRIAGIKSMALSMLDLPLAQAFQVCTGPLGRGRVWVPEKGPLAGFPKSRFMMGRLSPPLFCKLGCISLLERFAEGGYDVHGAPLGCRDWTRQVGSGYPCVPTSSSSSSNFHLRHSCDQQTSKQNPKPRNICPQAHPKPETPNP